ncbi:MAG: Acetyl-coenzyme A carboxylase carboxyl transferase subunit alpha [Chlamydiia bacterium]|nr:Acetyl-coenzyme A carboxylase carboxyl transferase subunit alpha [Chlamydiia bacterium]MCH9617989.1 Acetyl-coenzyme A carboxylase carboxyl transferase subunit alpha [Chlamydiia bacterium]MCH9623686.1 Acetyl-coenzyme A carboxylase carboxyl transferase subunit alpha [Chlamydiia bacterium]
MLLADQKTKSLSPIERVNIARAAARPKGADVIASITSSFEELHGDRLMGDDPAVICGVGEISDKRCMIIAQQKGSNAADRVKHNFGMMNPSGYRKAHRAIKLAERFSIPVITIIDTPGAFPGLSAEKNGISISIAENLSMMSDVKVPIITLVLGEGCSGGAIGIGINDQMIMLEHAYYSVISPEGCAAILWKDRSKKDLSAKELKMQSEDLRAFNMVDVIIPEGPEGFSVNKKSIFGSIKNEICLALDKLSQYSEEELLLVRYKKYRSF